MNIKQERKPNDIEMLNIMLRDIEERAKTRPDKAMYCKMKYSLIEDLWIYCRYERWKYANPLYERILSRQPDDSYFGKIYAAWSPPPRKGEE